MSGETHGLFSTTRRIISRRPDSVKPGVYIGVHLLSEEMSSSSPMIGVHLVGARPKVTMPLARAQCQCTTGPRIGWHPKATVMATGRASPLRNRGKLSYELDVGPRNLGNDVITSAAKSPWKQVGTVSQMSMV